MATPTYWDGALLLQLAQWHSTADMLMALSWLWSDRFLVEYAAFIEACPPGSEGARAAALICAYFDAVGTLHKHRLLNEELLFDWLAVAPVWDILKSYVFGRRQDTHLPTLWANFEALATAHKRRTRAYAT